MRNLLPKLCPVRETKEGRITQKVHHGGWGEGGKIFKKHSWMMLLPRPCHGAGYIYIKGLAAN